MEVQVPLNAATEADAVAVTHRGVISQCSSELRELAEVLILEPELVGVA
jgi:hypothetical protein